MVDSFSPDFIASLKVLTKCSARPFEDGWYGAVLICFTTLCFRNNPNSSDMNCGLLSDMDIRSYPCCENR